ncbi:hypothetical protein Cni_G23704 [Canna indica]|uniref:Transmembrane protein n=1 Tax=Canna indica TaxID=4628 RepID=A0AAQ3QMH6_9LILI|nr:hypothetical protein Cni_G23704 [Canna indica]
MSLQRLHFYFSLLLLFFISFSISKSAEADGPIPINKQQRYVKVLESLGIKCKCCDGDGGECRSSWESTCTKMECHNLKFL